MSSPHCTLSPHKTLLAKTKDPQEHTEEEWHLVSEGKLNPVLSDNENTAKIAREEAEHLAHEEAAKKVEEAERKVEEECKAQEEVVKREREEREVATWMAWEAVEAWADAEQRALEERLWDTAAQCSEMVAAPLQVAKPGGRMSGTLCILGTAKGKTTACKACCHAKVSCSWTKRMAREAQKKKQVHHSEEVDDIEMVEADEDDKEEETWSHFTVLPHLMEEHQDALRALTVTLDMLSMEFYEFQRDYWGFGGEVLRVMDTIALELKRANDLKEE
ncbi:hypothetical protein ID866_12475, partial [Astraeus odoratus]